MNISDISFATYGRTIVRDRLFPTRAIGINKLYYINDGEIDCRTPKGLHRLEKGHLYVIPNAVPITLFAAYADHTFFDFFTLPTVTNSSIIDIDIAEYPIIESALHTLNLYVERFPMRLIKRRNEQYDFVRSSLINLLFLIGEEFEIISAKDAAIDRVISYIHRNYAKPLTLADLVAVSHIEEGTLIRRFKRYTTITPYRYIRLLRVGMATMLLEEDGHTLEEVASKVGYADASTLSHAIKSCTTMHFRATF